MCICGVTSGVCEAEHVNVCLLVNIRLDYPVGWAVASSGLVAKYRSSHGPGLDIGETRGSVHWLLEGPGDTGWLLEKRWCLGDCYW